MSPMRDCKSEIPSRSSTSFTKEVFNSVAATAAASADSTETAALTRSQILVQANTSVLSIANSMPQSVLALLG